MKLSYIITRAILITSSGQRIPLDIISNDIVTKPEKLVKGEILKAFSSMKDKPVKVELKIKTI